jgi:protein-S-isoprenylcysteine O-methyltransferase Ste14
VKNKKIAQLFFKNRSYTPIPFLILMVFFENATIESLLSGFIISLSGEAVRLWGVCYAGSETRTTGKVGGTNLIISGPFAFVRNPLYLGNIIIYLGFGIMTLALFPYLQIIALIFFLIQYRLIVSEEEEYLFNTFGEKYKKYFDSVPRFFPRLNPFKDITIEQPEFNLKSGLKSEKRTLQALFGIAIFLFVKFFIRNYV